MTTSKVQADNAADVDIANKIMNALIVKGLNIKTLSEASGIKEHTIRHSLHQSRADHRSLTFREFHRIAEALQVQPSALMPETLVAA